MTQADHLYRAIEGNEQLRARSQEEHMKILVLFAHPNRHSFCAAYSPKKNRTVATIRNRLVALIDGVCSTRMSIK